MHYQLVNKKSFAKDKKRLQLSTAHEEKLHTYIIKLLSAEILPKMARDHQLAGEYKNYREFHLGGDLLVIYRINNEAIELLRMGSHSQLFK